MIDALCDDCRAHFDAVLAGLEALGIDYAINPRMVRGLDYYTRTTFEFVHDGLGAQAAIGGGGRYDGLMAELGGQPLSGIGFGLGVDRTLLAAQAEGLAVGEQSRCDVYGIPLGAAASAALVGVAGRLRRAGVRVDLAYGGRALKGAMKAADTSGARVALVLGDRDLRRRHGDGQAARRRRPVGGAPGRRRRGGARSCCPDCGLGGDRVRTAVRPSGWWPARPPTRRSPPGSRSRPAGPARRSLTAIPVSAAAEGATPVINPARPEPSAATAEYQSTNAAAVTISAR